MTGHRGALAVAVSGGGDSLALMHLLADWAKARKHPPPVVLTVDHGLRKTSARDAKQVAAWAKSARLPAHILAWRGAKPQTGIEAAAREARYRLMGDWLRKHGVSVLHLGHTLDDQAETFLLRLARGSGLDGLCAMRPKAPWPVPGFAGLSVARPLLGIGRAELRAYLQAKGQPWLDDPMNEDAAFDRVKIRQAQGALTALGLTPARIAAAAAHLSRARTALDSMTEALLARAVQKQGSKAVLLDPAALAAAPQEVGLRALASVLMAVSGQEYRPRFEALERLYRRIVEGKVGGGSTLHGCRIGPARKATSDFGLLVNPENPRKTAGSRKRAPAGP
jgi:tRNA(Ile)-lysidine synthase